MASALVSRFTAQTIVGLGVAVLGVLWLLDGMGIIDSAPLWRYWPLVFVLIGLGKLASGGRRALVSGGLWIALGAALVSGVNLFQLAPILIILLGLLIIWRGYGRQSPPARADGTGGRGDASAFALFAGFDRIVVDPQFTGAQLTAIFGGIDIDMRQSDLAADAVIDVLALFGGVNIWVPDHWVVVDQGSAVFGAFEIKSTGTVSDDDSSASPHPSPRLIVKGLAVFGGVEVTNVEPAHRRARRRHQEVAARQLQSAADELPRRGKRPE